MHAMSYRFREAWAHGGRTQDLGRPHRGALAIDQPLPAALFSLLCLHPVLYAAVHYLDALASCIEAPPPGPGGDEDAEAIARRVQRLAADTDPAYPLARIAVQSTNFVDLRVQGALTELSLLLAHNKVEPATYIVATVRADAPTQVVVAPQSVLLDHSRGLAEYAVLGFMHARGSDHHTVSAPGAETASHALEPGDTLHLVLEHRTPSASA